MMWKMELWRPGGQSHSGAAAQILVGLRMFFRGSSRTTTRFTRSSQSFLTKNGMCLRSCLRSCFFPNYGRSTFREYIYIYMNIP